MTIAVPATPIRTISASFRTAAVWLYIATLAWAPFPLGGAIAWAAGVQEMLIAICGILWVAAIAGTAGEHWKNNRIIVVPFALAILTLAWAIIQITPGVPIGWVHPIWDIASTALGKPLQGVISINPWRTEAEVAKLSSYVMACWLAFQMARRSEVAKLLLNAVIIIGATYAWYAFVLELVGTQQVNIFYSVPVRSTLLSGPFMLHNSFATFSGLVTLAAVAKLFAVGSESVSVGRGWRRSVRSIMQFCFGRGALFLVAGILTFAGVVASASRAGFAATMCALMALAFLARVLVHNNMSRRWAGIGIIAAATPLLILVALSGDTLGTRLDYLLASDATNEVRFSLWATTQRMISDAPWFGLGLGTFEDAYPLYATRIFPYVMDKAHCDYLEFAAGVGVPAAIAWWSAIAWLNGICFHGVRTRQRNRHYCLLAIGASVLIAVHSSVDFSLQMPAVALLYATLMGIGVAQARSTHSRVPSE